MNETLQVIANRKSLRAYAPTPITREETDMIIKMAMRAPTAGNMMLYSILEITLQETKERLAETCDHQPFIAKAPLVLIFLADFQRWYDYYRFSKVPELCQQNQQVFEQPQESDLMLASCDALIAAQTAVIAAESMGIGSCYIGDIMEQYEIHKELLNLPEHVFPITMLCFGKPKPSYQSQKPKSRLDQPYIHFKDQYQHLSDDQLSKIYRSEEEKLSPSGFLKNAQNYGQHMYLKKTGAAFSKEMRRSVQAALKTWMAKARSQKTE